MKMKLAKNLQAGDVLVGSKSGESRVVGEVEPSNVMMGCIAIETEHGTLYMDSDEEVPVS
jgi:hypothetical protein